MYGYLHLQLIRPNFVRIVHHQLLAKINNHQVVIINKLKHIRAVPEAAVEKSP